MHEAFYYAHARVDGVDECANQAREAIAHLQLQLWGLETKIKKLSEPQTYPDCELTPIIDQCKVISSEVQAVANWVRTIKVWTACARFGITPGGAAEAAGSRARELEDEIASDRKLHRMHDNTSERNRKAILGKYGWKGIPNCITHTVVLQIIERPPVRHVRTVRPRIIYIYI